MEIAIKKTFLAYCLCLVSFINGCGIISTPAERNDIYAKCTKGDTISFELFKKAERIIKTDKWYFIWLDLYEEKDGLLYAPHLLVCGHNLVLKGSSGIYPEIIEAHGDTLFGITSEGYLTDKNKRVKPYRDDLPKEIVLSLKKNEKLSNVSQRETEAVIDSIGFSPKFFTATIFTKTKNPDGFYFPGRKQYFEDIDSYSRMYVHEKVLEIPISKLIIHRSKDYLFTMADNNVRFKMYTLDDKVVEKFLLDIWQAIKN
jgi:hypothetical protein